MIRTILALVLGLIVGFVLVMGGEMVSYVVFPPPANLDMNDSEALRQYMETLPPSAFLLVLLSHFMGSFGSGFTAAMLAKRGKVIHALVMGVLFLITGIMNLRALPHPLWFMIVDPIIFLPAALAGAMLVARPTGAKPSPPAQDPLEISYEPPPVS